MDTSIEDMKLLALEETGNGTEDTAKEEENNSTVSYGQQPVLKQSIFKGYKLVCCCVLLFKQNWPGQVIKLPTLQCGDKHKNITAVNQYKIGVQIEGIIDIAKANNGMEDAARFD